MRTTHFDGYDAIEVTDEFGTFTALSILSALIDAYHGDVNAVEADIRAKRGRFAEGTNGERMNQRDVPPRRIQHGPLPGKTGHLQRIAERIATVRQAQSEWVAALPAKVRRQPRELTIWDAGQPGWVVLHQDVPLLRNEVQRLRAKLHWIQARAHEAFEGDAMRYVLALKEISDAAHDYDPDDEWV